MALKKDSSSPKKGMDRDKAVFDLDKTEYSFALNANFHDEHGSGQLNLQNEPSNIYCSGFKDGYKVIGHKFDINEDRTYFFLTNPDTGCSEIGYIDSMYNIDGLEQVEKECDCKISVVLENPLENQVQTAICSYHTVLSDFCELTQECTGCLNFSIDHPIHESNIHIKDEKTGKTIYWTDFFNPQRYLRLDYLDDYFYDVDPCSEESARTCLQCDKLRVFKLFDKPCLEVDVIQSGGNLRAGTYESIVAYCTKTGDEISDYYALTNPVPIHDKNNNILDQTNLDYLTNLAIGLNVSDLDSNYEYYKIAVIYRSGLDGSVNVFEYGVFPIDNERVSISTLVDKPTLNLTDVLGRRPFYTKARGMAQGNGYLFQYGLEQHRTVNLQPIVNLLGSLVKWSTVQADEDVYENGAHISNYLGYMRDEVEPLSIKFFFDGGHETDNFTFIARPPRDFEVDVLGSAAFPADNNTNSILDNGENCYANLRDKRWQFENTAEILGRCEVPAGSGVTTETVIREIEVSCFVEDGSGVAVVDSVAGPASVPIDGGTDLVTYINNNTAEILASSDPAWSAIQTILNNTYSSQTCDPEYEGDCEPPVLESIEILALSTDTEEVEESSIPYADYEHKAHPPSDCLSITDDVSGGGGGPDEDTLFRNTYMRPLETVYFRTAPPTNTSCGQAAIMGQLIVPPPPPGSAVDNAFFLQYDGALGSAGGQANLQTGITITGAGVNTALGYTNQLHTNAQWYQLDFNGVDTFALELSVVTPGSFTDDVCQNTVRVSTYTSCSATTDVSGYSTIITDITLANDPNKLIVLDAADFGGSSGTAYIAVDSPMACDSLGVIDFSGSGSCDVQIDGVTGTYIAFSAGNTASNFVAAYGAAILAAHNIIVTVGANQNQIKLRSTCDQYTNFAVVTVTNNMTGAISQEETYHVLQPPCGCINIFSREPELELQVTFTNLTFGKKMNYTVECEYIIPVLGGCDPIPYEYGLFSYWESTETYPCNKEMFDSSELTIFPTDFSDDDMREEFEEYYVVGTNPDGSYMLNGADFRDQPIRHYKFPCSKIVPFMSRSFENPGAFGKSVVYPIGFSIDNEAIQTFLNIAVNNGLITLEERARIKKYEIFRGDRSVDKSIIAKGLLFDVYRYPDSSGEVAYYPNYPLNSLGVDQLNGNVPHPFGNVRNRNFTFHSPDIHFYKPTLPRELKVEGYQFGKSGSYFDIVKDHPTYVLLGDKAYELATALAAAEVGLEIAITALDYYLQATAAGTVYGIVLAIVMALAITFALIGGLFKIGQIRYQWLETFRNLGHPHQFAYYQAVLGHYSYFVPNPNDTEVTRGLPAISYINDGRHQVTNEASGQSFNVNNMDREDSVFLTLGASHSLTYPSSYVNYDNTQSGAPSRRRWSGVGASGMLIGNAASPYASLKQYLPAQYGSLSSIKWIHTGFCGDLNSTLGCNPIFGGDTYISRFALKRKFPFFTSNSHGLAPLTPYKYSDYFNVWPDQESNRYYINYLIQDDSDNYVMMYVFPTNRSKYNLDYDAGSDFFFIKPPAKFYLFSYGFPYFLVESVINCNFRYAGREIKDNFYPNIGNIIDWTQESNVSIREPNTYLYNFVYSSLPTNYPWKTLPVNYNEEEYAGLADLENTVIYSKQDSTENSLTDPWLLYRALDSYGFPTSFGKLIDMDSIESEQILARFENGMTIFGAFDQLRDRVTPETKNIGTGGIFAGRSVNFNKTDLGYIGTQHKAKVSCEFGHFWADAKRGNVFNVAPNAKTVDDITLGVEKWFKENLPFKITQQIPGITQEALDNSFKGLGITMGWDARLKRVFLTKLDYRPLVSGIEFIDNNFYIRDPEKDDEYIKIELTDTDYFEDCSFTIAYSPLTKSWISYYSFKPNYYIAFNNYFQTGINYSVDASEVGLWSHLPFLSSYQVFYGKIYPWIIEDSLPTKGVNSMLHSIEYWLDVRKYYNKYNAADIKGVGFNKAFIYNMQQNSGQLNLVPQDNNDLSQSLEFPKFNNNSIDILQSEISGKWSFNYFYNTIKNEASGLPIWLYDCNQINKVLNNKLLDYSSSMKDRLRGDYFMLRLQQDVESRFKMIYRFNTDLRDYYQD